MSIAALVFDFDGVLANSEPLHLRSYQIVLGEIGLELDRQEYYQQFLGFDDPGAFRAIGLARDRRWSADEIATLVARKTAVFDDMLGSGHVLYPRAAACVERLAASLPLGIASGALRHEIEAVLAGTRLDRHIRFIVGSGDTAASKPAPDPYRRAAELHGVAPSACVAIEDSRWGIQSAKSAGMHCVGITHSYPAAELSSADAVIDSLDDFTIDLIQRLGA